MSKKEKYCYLLKHIRCSEYLTWEDILKIKKIGVQIITDYEFSKKIK